MSSILIIDSDVPDLPILAFKRIPKASQPETVLEYLAPLTERTMAARKPSVILVVNSVPAKGPVIIRHVTAHNLRPLELRPASDMSVICITTQVSPERLA